MMMTISFQVVLIAVALVALLAASGATASDSWKHHDPWGKPVWKPRPYKHWVKYYVPHVPIYSPKPHIPQPKPYTPWVPIIHPPKPYKPDVHIIGPPKPYWKSHRKPSWGKPHRRSHWGKPHHD